MSRVTDALLQGKAYSANRTQPMLDITYGGQFGYANDLTQWVSNSNYVRRNLIALLVEAPLFFKNMPNPDVWTSSLRALVETHPRTIEGLNAGLTVETAETPVGGAGEVQEEVTDVKRARSQPVFTYDEKYGMPIQTFLCDWIALGLMDPDTKIAGVGNLSGNRPSDMLPDQYAATMIFIEPDPTHRKVLKSWLCTNMFPKGTGDIIGKRDITSGLELQSLNIEFTAISQFNLGSNALAQRLLDSINISNANPYMRKAFIDSITADVAAASKTGYANSVTGVSGNAIA